MQNKTPNANSFDLNLLGIFDEIYKFGSVTKAAKSLKSSPPAVSQALQKLRLFFSDPLFVRNGARLTATTTADSIHTLLSNKYNCLLNGLEQLSTTTEKNLLIVHSSPYLSIRILPTIIRWVEQHAPECKVVHRDFVCQQETSEDLLLMRGVDLVFDVLPVYNFSIKTHQILSEGVTLSCRQKHPRLGSSLSIEEAQMEKFVLFDSHGLDVQLGQMQLNVELGGPSYNFTSASLLTIAAVVANSETVGVMPTWLYKKYGSSFGVRALDTDFDLTPVPIYMMYHKVSLQCTVFQNLVTFLENDFDKADSLHTTKYPKRLELA